MSSFSCQNLDCKRWTQDPIRDQWSILSVDSSYDAIEYPVCCKCYQNSKDMKNSILFYPEGFRFGTWSFSPIKTSYLLEQEMKLVMNIATTSDKSDFNLIRSSQHSNLKIIIHPSKSHPFLINVQECFRCKRWMNVVNPSLHQCINLPKMTCLYKF